MSRFRITWVVSWLAVITWCVAGVRAAPPPLLPPESTPAPKVLAVETFLADIAQNVAGDRLQVGALMPIGVDPHSFQPTPGDVVRAAESTVLIVHGAGVEEFLAELLENAGGERQVIEAAAGLTFRTPQEGEASDEAHTPHEATAEAGTEAEPEHTEEADHEEGDEHAAGDHHHEGDPHFWLDPNLVITYVENIRAGLSEADPDNATGYARNAEAYIGQLKRLDGWIAEQVQQIPPERRLLVTNHESFGYFADRYGFRVVGTIIPSVSTGAAPSAQELAQLIDHIKETGAPAIFLETGTNPQLAEQIAQDAGVKVVTELYSHSTTEAGGVAPTYIAMMEYNMRAIVDALK
jgi:ABC-type Zn uptake system ZnuABC Zn-binding protein ZnuA